MGNKFNDSMSKLDIGGINESDGIYAPVTSDDEIHDEHGKFIRAGEEPPNDLKKIDGKEVKHWTPINN